MGMLLILLKDRVEMALGADSAGRLATLGVTRVAVLQDEGGLAVALEGWAFDAVRWADSALEVVASGSGETRTLHQVAEVSVAAGATEEQGFPDHASRYP